MAAKTQFTLISFILLATLCIAQTKEGLVKGNEDSLIYVADIYDFDSYEVKAKASAAELEDNDFKYYVGDVVPYNSINGITGLLIEWGAANAEFATHLSQYDVYLKKALHPGATIDQQAAFTYENSFIRVVKCRRFFLELVRFARTYKKDTYQKNLQNPSFVLAVLMCDRESRRLIELRTKKINQLVEDLNKNQIKASWKDGHFAVGNRSMGTFDDDMKDMLKAYQENEITPEVFAARRKLNKKQVSEVKFLKVNASRFSSDKAKSDFFLAVTQLASPSAYAILSEEPNIAAYTRYARDTSLASLFRELNTVVHETCHMCTGREIENNRYFVSESIIIPVKRADVYNSHELIKVIPKEKYSVFFRNTYVFEVSWTSAQASGIYGLLNEFTAYYNGTKADWEIWTNREKIFNKYPAYRDGLKVIAGGEWDAYYEFSVMMAWYLDYSKKQYPEQFKMLMNHKALRVAYTLVSSRFSSLIETAGKKGTVDAKLMALYVETLPTLKAFGLEGCTEGNYRKYL